MSDLNELEAAIEKLIYERTGDTWIPVAFVVYVDLTDPETMQHSEPFWITPDGQRPYVTRGLLTNAAVEMDADTVGSLTYTDWEAEEDDD